VLTDAQVANVGAYELEVTLSAPAAFILSAHGPNGWLNVGDRNDHVAGHDDAVAWLNRVIVAVESTSWSQVKNLF
jgi:hypothetical protein